MTPHASIPHQRLLSGFFFVSLFTPTIVWARAGGGGSSSGGGDGGGALALIILIPVAIYAYYKRKKKIAATKAAMEKAKQGDTAWDETAIVERVQYVFREFQKAWSDMNLEAMKGLLTDSYLDRMALELHVLKVERRRNSIGEIREKIWVHVLDMHDNHDNTKDTFLAEITTSLDDKLIDVATGKTLYTDTSGFMEYWHFVREGSEWKLDKIGQGTEEIMLSKPDIAKFCTEHGFYYDADFGWLMMPNKGVLFRKSNFKKSDINNHVIGRVRNTVVEMYTFTPVAKDSLTTKPYLVAQAILPKSYINILIKKKKLFNFAPRGLRKITLESNEFNRKFSVFANPSDQVNTLELLAPNFMTRIHDLPFELNIEIVGQFLYFYTKDHKRVKYEDMFDILSWAFDEMKM